MSSWYSDINNYNDIIVTSRIRLARNIEGIPFPTRMTEAMRKDVNCRVRDILPDINTHFNIGLKFIDMNDVPEVEAYSMVERHIISPEFAANKEGRAILISEDESVCVMICEEDHLRIQVLKSGNSLDEAYSIAERLDTLLCERLRFAFNNELGYLTECPTNLGTGLRASVMLHLPLMTSTGQIAQIADSVGKIGLTVRGMYGEGSASKADLYQLSNQITLGISERDALNNLKAIAQQIVNKEIANADNCNRIKFEDSIWRAYGILKNARLLSSDEMMKYISLIKLGNTMGILNIDKSLPMRILVECQPNMIIRKTGATDSTERDVMRADTVRRLL